MNGSSHVRAFMCKGCAHGSCTWYHDCLKCAKGTQLFASLYLIRAPSSKTRVQGKIGLLDSSAGTMNHQRPLGGVQTEWPEGSVRNPAGPVPYLLILYFPPVYPHRPPRMPPKLMVSKHTWDIRAVPGSRAAHRRPSKSRDVPWAGPAPPETSW